MKTALAILLAVLKWTGIVLGALILLILLLSLIPLRLDAEWRTGELKADARWLFLRMRLSPKEKKEKKEKAEKEKEPEGEGEAPEPVPAPEEKKTPAVDNDPLPPETGKEPEGDKKEETEEAPEERKEKGGLQELWEKIEPFLDPGIRAVRYLGRHVKVRNLHASLECVSSDAAVTGMLTGAKWAFLGNVSKTLNVLFGKNVSYGELKVTPCWTKDMAKGEEAGCSVRFRPVHALAAGIIFLAGWLPKHLRNRRRKKKENSKRGKINGN